MLSRDFKDGLEFAKQMDAQDQLGEMRERFYQIPGEMYMDGNSLGLCSKDAEASLLNLLELWFDRALYGEYHLVSLLLLQYLHL